MATGTKAGVTYRGGTGSKPETRQRWVQPAGSGWIGDVSGPGGAADAGAAGCSLGCSLGCTGSRSRIPFDCSSAAWRRIRASSDSAGGTPAIAGPPDKPPLLRTASVTGRDLVLSGFTRAEAATSSSRLRLDWTCAAGRRSAAAVAAFTRLVAALLSISPALLTSASVLPPVSSVMPGICVAPGPAPPAASGCSLVPELTSERASTGLVRSLATATALSSACAPSKGNSAGGRLTEGSAGVKGAVAPAATSSTCALLPGQLIPSHHAVAKPTAAPTTKTAIITSAMRQPRPWSCSGVSQ